MNTSKEAYNSEMSKKEVKAQLDLAPDIKKREARRRIKDEFVEGKREAAVPVPVEARDKLRERILTLSLFPNTHNKEFLMGSY